MTTEPYPSLPRAVLLLGGTLAASVGLLWATQTLFPGWPEIVRLAVPTEIALLGAVAWGVRRSGVPWREALLWRALDARALPPLILVLLGAVTVFTELYVVMQEIVPVPAEFEQALRELLHISDAVDLAATVTVAVVVAPILEEALFRGVLLGGLARRRGPGAAVVWTALFFALFHLYNPWQVVPTFFLGLVLAWIVLTVRSLLAAILVHAAFNAFSLAVFAAPVDRVPSRAPAEWVVVGVVAGLLVGSFALLAGMAWLERQTGGGWFSGSSPPEEAEGPRSARPYTGEGAGSAGGPSTARR